MRIGTWQRLGIVLSVLWFLGAGLHTLDVEDGKAQAGAALSAEQCWYFQVRGRDLSKDCSKVFSDYMRVVEFGPITKAAVIAITPIPATRLLAFAIVWTTRWVWRGRAA